MVTMTVERHGRASATPHREADNTKRRGGLVSGCLYRNRLALRVAASRFAVLLACTLLEACAGHGGPKPVTSERQATQGTIGLNWRLLPAEATDAGISAPAVLRIPGSNRSFLLMQGPHHSILFAALGPVDTAIGPEAISGNTSLPPAIVPDPIDGTIDVIASSSEGDLYFEAINRDGSSRKGWRSFAGRLASPPAVVWDPALRSIHVLGRSADNHLWFATLDTNGTLLHKWVSLPGSSPSTPAAVWDAALGKVAVVVRGAHNALSFGLLNPDGSSDTALHEFTGSTPAAPSAIFDTIANRMYVFVRGDDDELWFSTLDPHGTILESWKAVPSILIAAPSATWDVSTETAYISALMPADFASASISPYLKALPVGEAAFVSQNVPSLKIHPRQRLTLSIRMKNEGQQAWTKRGGYALGYFDRAGRAASVWGVGSVSVRSTAPGQAETFSFSVTAPSAPGVYDLQWRMIRRGTPFGEVSRRTPVWVEAPSNDADRASVRNMLRSAWWRRFYDFNYADVRHRQGASTPPGFFLESLTGAYAPSYFTRTGGALVKLWLSSGDEPRAKDVLRYTLDLTTKARLNQVPQRAFVSGAIGLTDEIDGQASIILSWASYAASAHDPDFVNSTYDQVARLMDQSVSSKYFDPAFGLVRNLNLEHYRQGKLWNTYDLLTNAYIAEALSRMIAVAGSRGDAAHVSSWQKAETIVSEAINQRLSLSIDGQAVYAEMYRDDGTLQLYPGLSEFNFGPTAADWKGVDANRYARTVETLMRYAGFEWRGNRVIGVGFTNDEEPFPYTSGKSLAWQLLYFAKTGDWRQVGQTLSFIRAEQVANNQPRVYESSLPLASRVLVTDPGNGEQTVWILYALNELQRLSNASGRNEGSVF